MSSRPSSGPAATFSNPLIKRRPLADPWVTRWNGDYYLTGTMETEDRLTVWRSSTLTGLDATPGCEVWRAHAAGAQSRQIWAPELHRLAGAWYLYFTAGDGLDESHRHYVLTAEEPLGPFHELGRVDPGFDAYAIDGSVLALAGRLYWLYAAHDGLWAALMESPARAGSRRVRIAVGDQPWERAWLPSDRGWVRSDESFWIEAPQALVRDGRVFITYSAGHSATPHYALGLLECVGPPLEPSSWIKHPGPVFAPWSGTTGVVMTVGHASFTTSPDGAQSWIVYHAKDAPGATFAGRSVRAQRFVWRDDGTPDFGHPTPSGFLLAVPSGE